MTFRIAIILNLIINSAFSQQKNCSERFNLSCINTQYLESNFFVIGEMHYQSDETSVFQLELVRKLYERGSKEINIYLEAPPSVTYFISKYFYSEDEKWLYNEMLYGNFYRFIKGLITYKEKVKFRFIPLDLELSRNFKMVKRFLNEISSGDSDSNYLLLLLDEKKIKRKNKILKTIAQEYNDTNFNLKYSSILNKEDYNLFCQEMEILYKYGFVKNGISKADMILREKRMSEIIDCTYTENEVYILTIGKDHMTPEKNNMKANIFLNTPKDRTKLVLMPVVYQYFYWVYYDNKFYRTKDEFQFLIDNNIYDLVLLPPQQGQ